MHDLIHSYSPFLDIIIENNVCSPPSNACSVILKFQRTPLPTIQSETTSDSSRQLGIYDSLRRQQPSLALISALQLPCISAILLHRTKHRPIKKDGRSCKQTYQRGRRVFAIQGYQMKQARCRLWQLYAGV